MTVFNCISLPFAMKFSIFGHSLENFKKKFKIYLFRFVNNFYFVRLRPGLKYSKIWNCQQIMNHSASLVVSFSFLISLSGMNAPQMPSYVYICACVSLSSLLRALCYFLIRTEFRSSNGIFVVVIVVVVVTPRPKYTQHTYVQNKQRNDVMRSHCWFVRSFTAMLLFFFFLFGVAQP